MKKTRFTRALFLLLLIGLAFGGYQHLDFRKKLVKTTLKEHTNPSHPDSNPYAFDDDSDPDQDVISHSQAVPQEGSGQTSFSDRPKTLAQMPSFPVPKDAESFNHLADQLLTDLTSITDQNPEALMNAAARLEAIAESVTEHPQLKEEGISFYKRCSENNEFQPQVRALCLANLQELSPQIGAQISETIDPAISAMAAEDDF